ncbi:MAG: ATP-binding protein, partial [Pirellulales bacterium]|nr:ATP-binding protein [Pirellulales bacterium]
MSDHAKMQSKDMAISLEYILPSLAKNLYGDDWRITIRELLQNCHDAIADRDAWGGDKPRIDVTANAGEGTLTFYDNGLGMTLDEVEKYLATVGAGRKREQIEELGSHADRERLNQIIGQYGIGFLSCFIIADRVDVITRSTVDPEAEGVRALFTGETKWYFEKDAQAKPGTTVTLTLKKEAVLDPQTGERVLIQEFLNFERLISEVRRFGDLLPHPIYVHRSAEDQTGTLANAQHGPWEDEGYADQIGLIEFITTRHEQENKPLWAEPFRLTEEQDGVTAHGIVYFPCPTQEQRSSNESVARLELFCKRMFITDDMLPLLPEWATFAGAVVECPQLMPTLNRCDVIRHDQAFVNLKLALGEQIIRTLEKLSAERPEDFKRFREEHPERLYKSMAEDYRKSPSGKEPFYRRLITCIPFTVLDRSRPSGRLMTIPEYRRAFEANRIGDGGNSEDDRDQILFLHDPHAIGQFRAMIVQRELPVFLARHPAESILLQAYGDLFANEVEVVDVRQILDVYVDQIDQRPYESMKQFLASLDGGGPDEVTASRFQPAIVPAILTMSSADHPESALVLERLLKQGRSILDPKARRAIEEAKKSALEGRPFITVQL